MFRNMTQLADLSKQILEEKLIPSDIWYDQYHNKLDSDDAVFLERDSLLMSVLSDRNYPVELEIFQKMDHQGRGGIGFGGTYYYAQAFIDNCLSDIMKREGLKVEKNEIYKLVYQALFAQYPALKELLMKLPSHKPLIVKSLDADLGNGTDGRGKNSLGLQRLSNSNDYPAWAMSIVHLSVATIGNQTVFDELEKPLRVLIQGAKETIKSSSEKNSYGARAEATLADINSALSIIRMNGNCSLKKSATCLVSRL